jgi:hypothetical protein
MNPEISSAASYPRMSPNFLSSKPFLSDLHRRREAEITYTPVWSTYSFQICFCEFPNKNIRIRKCSKVQVLRKNTTSDNENSIPARIMSSKIEFSPVAVHTAEIQRSV